MLYVFRVQDLSVTNCEAVQRHNIYGWLVHWGVLPTPHRARTLVPGEVAIDRSDYSLSLSDY